MTFPWIWTGQFGIELGTLMACKAPILQRRELALLNTAHTYGDRTCCQCVAYDDYPFETSWSLQSLTTSAVGLSPAGDSVASGLCFGYDDVSATLYPPADVTVDDSHLPITSGIGVPAVSATKSM